MQNTVTVLLESEAQYGFGLQGLNQNELAFAALTEASEHEKQLLGFTLDRVAVMREAEGAQCYVEYSGNLEKYMNDQKIFTIEEAMKNVQEEYGLEMSDLTLVVDESCIKKIDLAALAEKYNVVKK